MNIIDKKQMNSCIALLTDFGNQDHYVGVMKGVILSINPNVNIIDISHNVESYNLKQASFMLLNSYQFFPKKTIFISVVDPGVGSLRKPIAIMTNNYFFIAPDNGIISYILHKDKPIKIIELTNNEYHLPDSSNTFHGRDIFAPVGAHLSMDYNIDKLGKELRIQDLITLELPYLKILKNQIIGEIIYHDKFGNLITSIPESILNKYVIKNIQVGSIIIDKIYKTFSDVKIGDILAYIGSSGYLEIGIRKANASKLFKNIKNIYVNY